MKPHDTIPCPPPRFEEPSVLDEAHAMQRQHRDWVRSAKARSLTLKTRGLPIAERMHAALGPTARGEETLTEYVDRMLGPRRPT
jgi:hypothetical protein